MAHYFHHFENERALIKVFKNYTPIPLTQVSNSEVGKLLFTKGAIGFFDPPQIVTWKGQTSELVAITSKPFSEGNLGEDWILGCVRDIYFPFFRESIERIDCTYYICGEWREMGLLETEYGSRSNVLILGAGIYLSEEVRFEEESITPFKMVEYQAIGEAAAWTSKGILRHQNTSHSKHQKKYLKPEIAEWERRLQSLKLKKAKLGVYADPSLDHEIEDIEEKLEELYIELENLSEI